MITRCLFLLGRQSGARQTQFAETLVIRAVAYAGLGPCRYHPIRKIVQERGAVACAAGAVSEI